jgi:hypothetical protein
MSQPEIVNSIVEGKVDLHKLLASKGVLVSEHIGKGRMSIQLPQGVFGTPKTSGTKEFVRNSVKSGEVSFIPKAITDKFRRIENAVRRERANAAIGFGEKFIPVDAYTKYKDSFVQHLDDFLQLRDQVYHSWDRYVSEFSSHLQAMLVEYEVPDVDNVADILLRQIPDKDAWSSAFYMWLQVESIDGEAPHSSFDPSILDDIKNSKAREAAEAAYEVTAVILNDAFDVMNRVLSSAQNGFIASKTIGAVNTVVKRILKRNILGNPQLVDFSEQIKLLSPKMTDIDDLAESVEVIMASLYGYAEELGIADRINLDNSVLTVDQLRTTKELLVS